MASGVILTRNSDANKKHPLHGILSPAQGMLFDICKFGVFGKCGKSVQCDNLRTVHSEEMRFNRGGDK